MRKAGDRDVGDRQQAIEDDGEIAREFVTVASFEFRLWRRERRAERVVNEIETHRASSKSRGVEVSHRDDTLFEDAGAALLVYVFSCVAGQRANQLDP